MASLVPMENADRHARANISLVSDGVNEVGNVMNDNWPKVDEAVCSTCICMPSPPNGVIPSVTL